MALQSLAFALDGFGWNYLHESGGNVQGQPHGGAFLQALQTGSVFHNDDLPDPIFALYGCPWFLAQEHAGGLFDVRMNGIFLSNVFDRVTQIADGFVCCPVLLLARPAAVVRVLAIAATLEFLSLSGGRVAISAKASYDRRGHSPRSRSVARKHLLPRHCCTHMLLLWALFNILLSFRGTSSWIYF